MSELAVSSGVDLAQLDTLGHTFIPHGLEESDFSQLYRGYDDLRYTLVDDDPDGKLNASITYILDNNGVGKYYFKATKAGEDNKTEAYRNAKSPDTKHTFHFGPLTPEIARYQYGGVLPTHVESFFADAAEAQHIISRNMRIGAQALGLAGVIDIGNAWAHRNHLRFNAYDPNAKDDQAEPHLDRSMLTGVLHQSIDGDEGLHGVPFGSMLDTDFTTAEIAAINDQLGRSPVILPLGHMALFLGAGYDRLRVIRPSLPERPKFVHGAGPITMSRTVWRYSLIDFRNPHARMVNYIVPGSAETDTPFSIRAA